MTEPWLRIRLEANADSPFTAMFEPSGMTYALSGGEQMLADVTARSTDEISIVHWDGGISIWAPGPVTTRDQAGVQLHELN